MYAFSSHCAENRDYTWLLKVKKPVTQQQLDAKPNCVVLGSKTVGNSTYEGEWLNGKKHGTGIIFAFAL
jgi:hypothetical protein